MDHPHIIARQSTAVAEGRIRAAARLDLDDLRGAVRLWDRYDQWHQVAPRLGRPSDLKFAAFVHERYFNGIRMSATARRAVAIGAQYFDQRLQIAAPAPLWVRPSFLGLARLLRLQEFYEVPLEDDCISNAYERLVDLETALGSPWDESSTITMRNRQLQGAAADLPVWQRAILVQLYNDRAVPLDRFDSVLKMARLARGIVDREAAYAAGYTKAQLTGLEAGSRTDRSHFDDHAAQYHLRPDRLRHAFLATFAPGVDFARFTVLQPFIPDAHEVEQLRDYMQRSPSLGEVLLQHRLTAGASLAVFADRLGIDRRAYHDLETNGRMPWEQTLPPLFALVPRDEVYRLLLWTHGTGIRNRQYPYFIHPRLRTEPIVPFANEVGFSLRMRNYRRMRRSPGEAIYWARKQHGYSLAELRERIDRQMAVPLLMLIERNLVAPSDAELTCLAAPLSLDANELIERRAHTVYPPLSRAMVLTLAGADGEIHLERLRHRPSPDMFWRLVELTGLTPQAVVQRLNARFQPTMSVARYRALRSTVPSG